MIHAHLRHHLKSSTQQITFMNFIRFLCFTYINKTSMNLYEKEKTGGHFDQTCLKRVMQSESKEMILRIQRVKGHLVLGQIFRG